MNTTAIKIVVIIGILLIVGSLVYKYRKPLKIIAGIGGIGLAGYIAAGGTLAGYKLYQKYRAAGLLKTESAIEAEAATGATEITAAGATEAATGAAATAADVAALSSEGVIVADAAAFTGVAETGAMAGGLITGLETAGEIALLAL